MRTGDEEVPHLSITWRQQIDNAIIFLSSIKRVIVIDNELDNDEPTRPLFSTNRYNWWPTMSIDKFVCRICRTVGDSDPSLNRTIYIGDTSTVLYAVCEEGKTRQIFTPSLARVVTHSTEWQLAIKKNRKGVNDRSSCTSYFNRWLVTYCRINICLQFQTNKARLPPQIPLSSPERPSADGLTYAEPYSDNLGGGVFRKDL